VSRTVAAFVAAALLGLSGCSWGSDEAEPPAPEPKTPLERPAPVQQAPKVQFVPPKREASTPVPVTDGDGPLAEALRGSRARLLGPVERYGPDPESPWAVAHAMLALGPEMAIPGTDQPAVDHLAATYGQPLRVGRERLWTFPPKRGGHLVDVHTDLLLKAFTEGGLPPDRAVTVAGEPTTLGDLYRYSLFRAWTDGEGSTGFQGGGFRDAPWALQALATWAPPHLTWTAENGRRMQLDDLTRGLREAIARDTAFMKAAHAEDRTMQKDIRRGFFGWTCGGQHALQGLTYAVARGFGNAADKKEVCDQVDLLGWRTDVELGTLDPLIASSDEPIQVLMYVQRLKYLGHTLETVHKAAAMGVCELTEAQRRHSHRVARELVRTVAGLTELGAFDRLEEFAANPAFDPIRKGGGRQVMLDLIGDSAHAIRGIDMATGTGTIRY